MRWWGGAGIGLRGLRRGVAGVRRRHDLGHGREGTAPQDPYARHRRPGVEPEVLRRVDRPPQVAVGGKQVKVTYSERDKYDRLLGTVWFGGEDINLRMVAEGMAWCYHYSRNAKYAAAQDAARTRRIGLWADPNAQDPWAYRKGIKPQGATQQVVRQGLTGAESTRTPDGYFSGSRVEYRAGNGPVASRTPAPVCDKWPDTGFWLSTNSMKRHNRGCENYRKTRGYPCRKDEGSPCGKCGG